MAQKQAHIRIIGKVQGVYYRLWTQETAKELGLTGWVRNVKDGNVEAVFCGEENAVTAMLAACIEGPAAAKVENIEHLPPLDFSSNNFDVLPTV